MIKPILPALIFILGAIPIPFLKGKLKQFYLLLVPVLALIDLYSLGVGTQWGIPFLGYELIFLKVDRLSLIIGYIFVLIGFLALLYSLHVKEDLQHIAAFLYMASSLGVVFSGDYFSLFVFWEIMAVTSVFLVWSQREKASLDAGFRYLLMHILGGCCLLTGIIIQVIETGTVALTPPMNGWASLLILIGFGLNTAFIPLHTWLPDAYPEGTVVGSVFLSVFTTKTGVYTLARCFSGNEILAYMGGIMAIYGVIFALLQNDIRRLISYHIVSQVGYMVAGVGVGTELGVNGGIAHVFNHILYKALLFMCTGSILYMSGKRKLTELGGLARMMPVTCITCVIASLSISGVPGFNGFVSKGMVIGSATESQKPFLELMLTLASVGTFLSFTKLCYFTFFKRNDEIKAKESPLNMQVAMILTASLCILFGVFPQILFHVLPYTPVGYHPYTFFHVIGVAQLFLVAGFVFFKARSAFSPHPWIILDFDYLYRKAFQAIAWFCRKPLNDFRLSIQALFSKAVGYIASLSRNPFSPKGGDYNENIYRNPMGLGVLLAILFLFLYGLIYLVRL
jgi:multicomponent Na+:H+ antiporter subunit D